MPGKTRLSTVLGVRIPSNAMVKFSGSFKILLLAVLALCVGNAFGSLTHDPLDLPKADSSDTAWTLARRSVWDGSDVVADSTAGEGSWRYRIPFGLNAVAEAQKASAGKWKLTYLVSDPVGTPEILLDDSGAVVGRTAFGPYGELEDFQGSRQTDFLFGGRKWDGDLQAGVFGYRLYDPEQGQFLTTDPMGQFWNPYSYGGGDPLSGIDPWGLEFGPTPSTCYDGFQNWWAGGGVPFDPGGDAAGARDVSAAMPIFHPTFSLPAPASIGAPDLSAVRTKVPALTQPIEGGAWDPLVVGPNLWQNARRAHQVAMIDKGRAAGYKEAALQSLKIAVTVEAAASIGAAGVANIAETEGAVQIANSWRLGGFKSASKWANQMAKRGWTESEITEAILSGEPYPATNLVNKANLAIRYVNPTTGRSVVLDNVTKEVLQVGGNGFVW